MTTSVTPVAPRRARLLRYSLWQFRDFGFNIAIVSIILFGLLGTIFILGIHTTEQLGRLNPSNLLAFKLRTFSQVYAMFGVVGPVIAMSGIISSDRAGGFTRFLFSKPLSPRMFYGQSLVVRLIGFLVVGHILVLAYGLYEPPAYTIKFLVDMAVMFFAVGGIVFLCSSLTRFDGLIVVFFLLLADIFWDRWENLTGIKKAVTYLLPPINHITSVHDWVLNVNTLSGDVSAVAFPTKWVLWNAGYGLACVLLGLFMLRRMPLTKS